MPIMEGVAGVLNQLLAAAPQARGVLVAGQMGGVILVDSAGQALTNYLSWRDQRTRAKHPSGRSFLEAARQAWSDREFAELGSELQAGSAAGLIFWLTKSGQLPPRATPATVADFALGRLCNVTPQMHPTQALGMLHLPTGTWNFEAFDKLGLAALRCPALAGLGEPVGWYATAGRKLPCYVALGDQQCALYGAGLAADELSLNISTGSQVSRLTSQLELGPYQTRPYFGGQFLNTITHLPAGRSLIVLVDLLTELARDHDVKFANPWKYISKAAERADGGGLACDLAFFSGPLGDRGSIHGITTENLTVGNLFHAALTGMAENYARCAGRLWPDRTWQRVAVTGGLTQSLPVLRTLLARRFDAPLREPPAAEETLLGLAALASTLKAGHD
jgi:sugar (pentulose or hexulose) kinase